MHILLTYAISIKIMEHEIGKKRIKKDVSLTVTKKIHSLNEMLAHSRPLYDFMHVPKDKPNLNASCFNRRDSKNRYKNIKDKARTPLEYNKLASNNNLKECHHTCSFILS